MTRSVLLAFLVGCLAPLAAAQDCKLVRVAEWPIRLERGLPIVDGAINGQKANVLIHTGAYASLVTKDAADRFRLPASGTTRETLGDGSSVGVVKLDELRIGSTTARGLSVRVALDQPVPGVDFLLGADFFRRYDVELDYAGGYIRIFQSLRCVGGSLAYWDPKANRIGLEAGDSIVIPITVNQKRGMALLNTGATASSVSAHFARTLGMVPPAPGVLPAGCRGKVPDWMGRLDTVEIGNQVTRDANLFLDPPSRTRSGDSFDVALGSDFLRKHRVLVARSQATLYFSYLGGRVFRAEPSLPCDERLAGKAASEARQVLDAAIAADPRDAKALIHRAALRLKGDDAAGALSDLDAVLAIEPRNPVAYSYRADARAAGKDFPGALADSELALRYGLVSGRVFTARGAYYRGQGDFAAAVRECDQAVELEPASFTFAFTRARHLYYAGRLQDSEKEYVRALTLDPSPFASLWLSQVRASQGGDDRAALEEGRARLKEGQWPGPVMDHLLGRIDPQALMAAAANPDPKLRQAHECEARYYMGARRALAGKADEARALYQLAVDQCPRGFIEYEAAVVALSGAMRSRAD